MGSYYPYGEAKSGTVSNADSFATYYRDSGGLDYAQQRYYASGSGRFLTPDPASAGSNWYAYVSGDPVSWLDPQGLNLEGPRDRDTGVCEAQFSSCSPLGGGGQGGGGGGSWGDSCNVMGWAGRFCPLQVPIIIYEPPPEARPDICRVEVWYRPVGGTLGLANHVIIRTFINGILEATYEGEPSSSPLNQLQGGQVFLEGVRTTNPQGVGGLGTLLKGITAARGDMSNGFDVCNAVQRLDQANTRYNTNQLQYIIGAEPNSNSYASTVLAYSGLLQFFPKPPSVPGWGYDVIANPMGYY